MICSWWHWARVSNCQCYVHTEVGKCQPAVGLLLSWRERRLQALPTFGAAGTLCSKAAGQESQHRGSWLPAMQSPNPAQRPPWRLWKVLAMWIRSVCLQTSKQLSVLSSTTKVTTRWDWYQKVAQTQKQAGPKMFWRQRWCTLCLRGEGRNRQELTPVNTYPDDRQARVATWEQINFHPSLK